MKIIITLITLLLNGMLMAEEIKTPPVDNVSIWEPGWGGRGMLSLNKPGYGLGVRMKGKGLIEKDVIDRISKYDLELSNQILGLKKQYPYKYMQIIRVAENLFRLAENSTDEITEQTIVKAIKLEFETRQLAERYRMAKESEKEQIKADIKTKLNELFDIRTKIHEIRIKNIETRLNELKKDIDERKKNKNKIVDERLDELLGRKKFRW